MECIAITLAGDCAQHALVDNLHHQNFYFQIKKISAEKNYLSMYLLKIIGTFGLHIQISDKII